LCCTRECKLMSGSQQVLIGGAPSGGYQIERSLRFNSADTAYLNRTPASAGNRKTWTWSGWVKKATTGTNIGLFSADNTGASNSYFLLRFNNGEELSIFQYTGSAYDINIATSSVYRDPSAWYNIVIATDTTQATDTNRIKVYVNGVQVTSFRLTTWPTQNLDTYVNGNGFPHSVGSSIGAITSPSDCFDGYMTEINFIDGQALTPSDFGETDSATGVWKPKKFSGTYGTNGFYLNFSDNSNTTSTTLGKDSSGNGNNWTPSGFSVASGAGNDSLVDTPTSYGTDTTGAGGEVRGNYCTANAVDLGSVAAPTNGNLAQTLSGLNGTGASGTLAVTTGKWYWEVTSNATTNAAQYVGVIRGALPSTAGPTTNPSGFYYGASGNNREDGTTVTYGNTWTNLGVDYVIGVALDCDANTVVFYVNNVSQGTRNLPSTTSGWKPQLGFNSSSGSAAMNYNFGQRPFAYTAPSGFKALCTQNLPPVTIGATSTTQANDYFNVVLWTGNDATRTITGYGFQPDFIWTKGRNVAAGHRLSDAVRGASGGTMLNLNTASTGAENTDTAITGFASDGFTMDGSNHPNVSPYTYVGWGWNAGGSNQTISVGQYATSPANVPSIASTVRANTTAGFSVLTYNPGNTSGTIGHGLGVAPQFIIVRSRTNSGGDPWGVYHVSLGNTKYLRLNTTDAEATLSTVWNNTSPTSTVVSIGTSDIVSSADTSFIMYCFAPVAGYSAFGSYTGNGSSDGPFVFLGFRPRFIMIKESSSTGSWSMLDTARSPSNAAGTNTTLWANLTDAEGGAAAALDILSNGFKIRDTDSDKNTNAQTYIYAAFAENPFKYSLAR
jgi:hypothetical protein